jgi:transcriptional regulator with XRE-family HTH domain
VETQAEQLIPGRLAVFLLDKKEASDQMEREAGVRNQADERIDERDEFAALEEAALSDLENGRRKGTTAALKKIANVLKVSLDLIV